MISYISYVDFYFSTFYIFYGIPYGNRDYDSSMIHDIYMILYVRYYHTVVSLYDRQGVPVKRGVNS